MEFGEGFVDGGGLYDLFEGVDVLELRVGVVDGVGVVDVGDFGKVFFFGVIFEVVC